MAGFRDLADRLAELQGIPSRIAADAAEGISALVKQEFEQGTDPYGRAWKPLLPQTVRRKGGDSRILLRTDDLAQGSFAQPTSGAGVQVISVSYGELHQRGTKHMVARKILPDGSDLPDAWQAVIEKASSAAFQKALK